MSTSMYEGQVQSRAKDLAGLSEKAAAERGKAARERQSASRSRSGITRTTSASQRERKELDAAKAEERAAKHEQKAADYDIQATRKRDSLNQAQRSLERAQGSQQRKDEAVRKRDEAARKRQRRDELREIADIERRRRTAMQPAPAFSARRADQVRPYGDRVPYADGPPITVDANRRGQSSSPPAATPSSEADHAYDVCLSFASEQRGYVELVARGLKSRGYRVFYDDDEQSNVWGKDLTEYFDWVYRKASRVCVMFISAEYAQKPWTRLERRSALARAVEQDEYVLPARFDDTTLDGLRPTIAYISLTKYAPESLVDLIVQKLGAPADT